MKKTILPLVLLLTIGTVQAKSIDRHLTNEGERSSKKNTTVVRNILSDKLPARLLTTIKKEYREYWITSLYKQDASGKISYHIIVENADKKVVMSATRKTRWSVERVVPKDETL
ncbi:MAG TPA: hypothetical protein VGM31_13725 [Puia sp.]|jgi:acyl CoA:acetate/3-ketoacid CoA transferase alpha subunit